MPNDNYTQAALAADGQFRNRVKAALSSVAWQVLGESTTTPNHDNRAKYAQQVTRQLDSEVMIILPSFVMRPNVINFATSYTYDFPTQLGHVQSATGDADIMSQLATDWDSMAAAAGFSTP